MSLSDNAAAARWNEPAVAFAFEAETPFGPLWLDIEAAGPACAAEAARRLGDVEPLLSVLDTWLDAALDWQWRAVDAFARPPGLAVAHWAGGGLAARVALPWRLLRNRPSPGSSLVWEAAPTRCVLATLELARGEEAMLEPGGVVLLPASFEPEWVVLLRAEGEAPGEGRVVTLAQPEHPTWGLPSVDQLPKGTWEVRCALSAPLASEVLAGYRELDTAIRPDLKAGLQLWHVPPGEPPRRRASGKLLPWGQGHALWLTSE